MSLRFHGRFVGLPTSVTLVIRLLSCMFLVRFVRLPSCVSLFRHVGLLTSVVGVPLVGLLGLGFILMRLRLPLLLGVVPPVSISSLGADRLSSLGCFFPHP